MDWSLDERVCGRWCTDSSRSKEYCVFAMTHAQQPPKTIGKLIDEVERIREILFCLQRDLEKLEIVETALSGDEQKEA
jgi:hypothetical protein